jgi:methionyl-tRNA formyltransferase
MRIVFMGTSEFAVPTVEYLAASEHELVAVYTQPDKHAGRGRALTQPRVKTVALDHALLVRQPESLKDSGVVDSLNQLKPDTIVVAAFGRILPDSVLTMPDFGCINIHPSLLPRHRGPSPVQGAVLAGDECTGVTIMLMDAGVDSGPILAQREVPIDPADTAQSLSAKLALLGAQLLQETLPLWFSRAITPQPQNDKDASYTTTLAKEQGVIDWHLPAVDIWRRVRAYQPWPGCHTRWRRSALKVLEAAYLPGGRDQPGRVIALEGNDVGVQTGDGILRLLTVQLEGRRKLSAKEFAQGQRDFVGALLPS